MAVTENQTPAFTPGDLPPMDVAGRIDRLRQSFGEAGIDALVVSELTNIRYLTGFTGSSAALLVTPDHTVFVTDGRYRTQSEQQLSAAGVKSDIEITAEGPEVAVAAASTDCRPSGTRSGLDLVVLPASVVERVVLR